jgi:hypothetical protein
MQLVSSGLENHPDGSGNINPIVSGNWDTIESWFNPAAGLTASQSGTTVTASSAVFQSWDVGSVIRYADGSTDTIATVTDSTHVEVGVSRTVGAQAFFLYNTGEALRGTLLRGLLGVTEINSAAHDGAFLAIDATSEKVEAVTSLSYDGSDFLFTEPVTIDAASGSPSVWSMLTVRATDVSTSSEGWGLLSQILVSPTSASTAGSAAGCFTVSDTGATANITGTGLGISGIYADVAHGNTTYTLETLNGGYFKVSHTSGATKVDDVRGVAILMDYAETSNVPDLGAGLYIYASTGSGSPTAQWAIYQAGTSDRNFFAGTTQFDGIRGSMYQTNTATAVTVSVTDTWYEITTGWTDGGNGNDTTFQNSHEILVATAGVYWISWHIAVTVGTAAQNIEATITVNGTADTNLSNHVYVGNTTQDYPFSGQGLVSLSASDVVALAVRNRTGTNNVTVEHAGLTLLAVGT